MPLSVRKLLAATAGLAGTAFASTPASACTVAGSTVSLGSPSSYAVAATAQQGSGSAGLQCDVTLALLTAHYVGLSLDASTFLLTGPNSQTISFIPSLSQNGAALTVGSFQNLSSISVLSLFAGTNSTVPIYIRTVPKSALPAGTYNGFMDLRWYYSVCSVGVLACLSYSASPGFVRPLLGAPTWGSGTAVRINIQLVIQNDCIITAPNATFGSAPLVSSFNPITRTILIRCSAGAAYTVGLDNGANALNGVRRMRDGTTSNYISYDIYKTATSTSRWGPTGADRRSSASADANAGTYDSVTTQGYTYRAQVLPGQVTPPAGSYKDTVRIDVTF